jgi:hypothetical protein
MMRENIGTGILYVCAALIFCLCSWGIYRAIPDLTVHSNGDSIGYERIAQQFVMTGKLTDPAVRGGIPIQPIGYPLFVGLLYKLCGPDLRIIIFIQVLLSLLCIWLIFVIAQRLFGLAIARITLFLSALNLGFLVYAQLMLAETLMLTCLLLFFERITAFLSEQKMAQLVQAGLVLGVSVLIKPMALLYIFFLLPFIWFCMHMAHVQKLKYIGMLLISFYAPLVSYMSYNYALYRCFRYAPMTSLNIYQCFLSKVIAHIEHEPVEQVRTQTLAFTGAHGFDEHGWDANRALFFYYLHKHPFVFVYVWGINVIKTIAGLYTTQLKLLLNNSLVGGKHSFFNFSGSFCERCVSYVMGGTANRTIAVLALAEAVFNLLRWLFVFFACFFLVRASRWCILYLFGSYSLQCALVTGIDGCCRYRMTFEPILIILAAIGIYALVCTGYKKRVHR